ncbi:MAG: penicillin-binding protein activator, partial [candidate division Zixibacteria bacterium]|nr:penicillin-binding protein activator [candidate division Zixibacteria bacterium]
DVYKRQPVDPPAAAGDWEQGQRLLRSGDYAGAARLFEQLAAQHPASPALPLFVFSRAKANYYGGEYAKAAAGFSQLLSRFPRAPEVPYAHFFLGNTACRRGDLDRALHDYLEAYRLSTDDRLDKLAQESVRALLSGDGAVTVTAADFLNIPETRRCRLIDDLEEPLRRRGEAGVAAELMASCGWTLDTAGIDRSDAGADAIEVAVVLPLSGELQEFGNEIYRGALVGASMYAAQSGRQVVLAPYDTEGDAIAAARLVGELAGGTADGVIGPLTSEEAAVAAARLHGADLPLVIPAATDAGLTRLSESSFQLSPNIELQAVRMADYAIDVLRAATAAIIAPAGGEHQRMAERFAERFRQRGGAVAASEYYGPRDRDYGPCLRDLKGALLGEVADSSVWLDNRGDTIEADGIAAEVDVLYLPGRAEQIRMLLPQLRFHNLRGRYLGSDGWGDEEIFRLGDDVTQHAVFPSPFLPAPPSEEAMRFAAAYDERYGAEPERLARLGYDAMQLIVRAVERGRDSRRETARLLAAVRDYAGAAGAVTFGEQRENVAIPLYRIADGAAVPLAEPAPAE